MNAVVRRMLLLIMVLIGFGLVLPVVRARQPGGAPTATITATPEPRAGLASSITAVYLPLVVAAGSKPSAPTPGAATATPGAATATPGAATATPTGTPSTGSKPFFLQGSGSDVQNTAEPDLLVDPTGGVHLAYITFRRNTTKAVFYAFCAGGASGGCTRAQDFATTVFAFPDGSDGPDDVTLALDPSGRPRMLLAMSGTYQYLSCNADCANAMNWTTTTAASYNGVVDYHSRRFAVDAQGHPSFVYKDDGNGAHAGTWYAFCTAADCTTPANWQETKVTSAVVELPSLAVTSAGLPRFAGRVNGSNKLGYLECNATCGDSASWTGVVFDAVNPYYSAFSLQVGTDDLPRLAVAPGDVNGSAFVANTLYYYTCATACGDGAANDWHGGPINTPNRAGDAVALALTRQNQPRLTYQDQDAGMVYLTCDNDCDTANAAWQPQVIETVADLNAGEPTPPVSACANPLHQTWSLGYWAALALDTSDRPRAAYDAQHLVTCSSGGQVQVETDIAWARFAPLSQP